MKQTTVINAIQMREKKHRMKNSSEPLPPIKYCIKYEWTAERKRMKKKYTKIAEYINEFIIN